MKKLLFILVLITATFDIHSQDAHPTDTVKQLTLYDIQRNSFYAQTHFMTIEAFYERVLPVKNKVGFIVGGGIVQTVAFSDATNLGIKIGLILGRYKHFFETGIILAPLKNDLNLLSPMVGYRYQNPRGFLLRVDVTVFSESNDVFPLPGIGLGYSF